MQEVLQFDVGQYERHRVEWSFDRFWGRLRIRVDGFLVEADRVVFSTRLTRRYQFVVGQAERHAVAIEKRRKVFFAGFRSSTYRVFIDGQLVITREL